MEIVFTTLIWAAVLQGVLLGLIFIFSKKHKSFSNKLLGLFLITFILGAASDLLPFDSIGNYSIMKYFTLPEVKLLFPVLFFHYILEKIGKSSKYRKFLAAQYLLAFTIIGITFLNILLFLFSGQSIYDYFSFESVDKFFMVHQYYAYLLTVLVFVLAIFETMRYQNIVKNEYSDLTLLAINWLWLFILIFAPVIVLWGVELIRILTGGVGQSDIVVVLWGFVAICIYLVSFKAFTHQDLFHSSRTTKENKPVKNIQHNTIKEEPKISVCRTIKNSMDEGKYYLNQELSIHDFAKEINVSARTISTCINKNFGFNFNEWVNNYRVEEALEILKKDSNNQLSIEGIGSESGFKSRSAMYIAFKKKTGKTPGNFRN
ncbi:helix-turn-helix domain-containing protein [Sunxiuqinia sp. A32]|uniref:helix-turn-helix domain-containing protein n=1 Tax=Sunxiuqinia sp. A32 TaxID=3461496 RepID=UPI0040464B61